MRDAPEAFAFTLERELSLPEQSWRARLSGGAWFVAHRGSLAVGLACGVPTSGANTRQLVGMWVAPASRGAGVGDALVAAVLRWAAAEGATRVELWVVDS